MSHYQIKNRWTGAVIYEGEAESLKDLVGTAVEKNISLGGAYLGGANLRDANLGGANLRGAYLGGAYLGGAYLGGAYHLISFSGIGSARRNTSYWLEADKVWCGCFNGTLEEFRDQVEETHEENPQYLAEYRAGIAFLAACIAAIPEVEKEAGRKAYAEMMAKPAPVEPIVKIAEASK